MRILIFLTFLSCMVCCGQNELRIPDQPAINDLASPIFLKADTNWINLKDYFLTPEKIQKITLASGVDMNWDKERQMIRLVAADSGDLLSNMRIRYGGYNYDIPVIQQRFSGSMGRFRTDEWRDDTLFLHSSSPLINYAVYFQNYKLGKKLLLESDSRLGIIIPEAAKRFKQGELRIWCLDRAGISNDIVIPLERGKLVTETTRLDPQDKRMSLFYSLEANSFNNSGTIFVSDSVEIIYRNPNIMRIQQKIEEGYFKELGINTLYFFFSPPQDSMILDMERLSDEARQYGINIIQQDSSDMSIKERSDLRVYEQAVRVFALSNESFKNLDQAIEKSFYQDGIYSDRIHFSGWKDKARFISRTDEYVKSVTGQNDTTYQKLVQFLVFNTTIPGIPMIYFGDEIGFSGGQGRGMYLDSLSDEEKEVKAKVSALNKLRLENMALTYGDFIPLRIEDRIYAYLRSYFGKNILVVFNKNKESVSLKLDLPQMKREENFNSLFGNRFSYDNSKIILDVSANGAEIIYN